MNVDEDREDGKRNEAVSLEMSVRGLLFRSFKKVLLADGGDRAWDTEQNHYHFYEQRIEDARLEEVLKQVKAQGIEVVSGFRAVSSIAEPFSNPEKEYMYRSGEGFN